MSEILDHQTLEPVKSKWLLVTITDYSEPILKISHYVVPDTKRSRDWLAQRQTFTTAASYEPIEVMAPIVGVHAVLRYTDEKRDFIACGLDEQHKARHGQSFDQAFDRVREEVTCMRCKANLRDNAELLDEQIVEVRNHGAVLKPWSWDNVPEDYRPGGPKHRFQEESTS